MTESRVVRTEELPSQSFQRGESYMANPVSATQSLSLSPCLSLPVSLSLTSRSATLTMCLNIHLPTNRAKEHHTHPK